MELNFLQDIEIDTGNLELEWERHPYLYARYCEESALANRRSKEAYHRQKVCYSTLILRSEEELKAIGQKTSEAIKDAWVLSQPAYEEATQERHQAEYEAEHLQNAVYAFGHRKTALEELVRLHMTGYYSSPREDRALDPEYRQRWVEQKAANKEAASEAVSANVRSNLNASRSRRV